MLRSFASNSEEYGAWLATCLTTHRRRIRVQILGVDHNPLSEITTVRDGQVTFDVSRPTYRLCNVSLTDPSRSIGWEPDSASSLHTSMTRLIRVYDERLVPGVGWLGPAVFTGPPQPDGFDRDGAEVSITAAGKEDILGDIARHYEAKRKRKLTAVIRDLLELAGEAPEHIHLPALDETLPERLTLGRGDAFLPHVRKLAREARCVIFPDGRGHWVMRRQPRNHSITIDRQSLAAAVRVDREIGEFHNRWIVLGPKPKGDKKRIGADVGLPKKHPLSAQSLKRNGQPRWEIDTEEMSQLKTNAKARAIAKDRRDDQMRMTSSYSVECLPFPQIEEFDLLRVVDPTLGTVSLRFRQATLPFVDGTMSLGAVKRRSLVAAGKSGRGGRPRRDGRD